MLFVVCWMRLDALYLRTRPSSGRRVGERLSLWLMKLGDAIVVVQRRWSVV